MTKQRRLKKESQVLIVAFFLKSHTIMGVTIFSPNVTTESFLDS